MTQLSNMHCKPMRGHGSRLSDAERDKLLAQIPEWQLVDDGAGISREFNFPGFLEAMAFVNQMAALAEAEDHHPNFSVRFRKVEVSLSTHDAGGLTVNDLIVAARLDGLVG